MTIPPSDSPACIDLPALEAWCRALHQHLLARRQRACLWISGDDPSGAAQALCELWPAREAAPLWLGTGEALSTAVAPPVRALTMAKAATQLGGEQSLVIFDAAQPATGFNPDAFGAVTGTLKAGGLLVLMTPATWAATDPAPAPDGDHMRLAHWPFEREQLTARYLARLARRLSSHANVLHWPQGGHLPAPSLDSGNQAARSDAIADSDCLTQDQAASVAALEALAPARPVVVSADRGRGKSGALGIAAARCLAAGQDVWLTAPRPAAVSAIFERLAALLPRGQREGNVFRLPAGQADDDTASGSELRFLAPDAIEAARLACHDELLPRLFVDEAAAIPTPLLKGYLANFPRIAFATTVHGYEGTGRGFQLRFRHHLERQCPGWQALEMTTPVRWAPGDPLEALTDDLLLLSAQPPELPELPEPCAKNAQQWLEGCDIVVLERDALARDEAALRQLFGLLVQAHYRTAPADLRQLLDTPGLTLMAIRQRDDTTGRDAWLGVVAAVEEGGFPTPLAHDIWCGKRRPRGHLLAQSLAAHAGHQSAAEARWWRVLRIAVHPALWRRGQGARLLKALEQQALAAGVTRLGTSFGAEADLVAFWQAQGFVPLRMGLKRDAASGEHAVMMGKAIGESGSDASAPQDQLTQDALLGALQQDFQRLLPSLLKHELHALPPVLAERLRQRGSETDLAMLTPAACAQRLDWYCRGGGGLALVRPWLETVLEASEPSRLGEASRHGLVLALGGQDAPAFVSWAEGQGIVGRKARDRWCRASVGHLIEKSD
ncbi:MULTISPECIES: GNAT family N-acetyltransferase [Cobetia]|uniref:tRNA(Met) cytidine acetyltransferase TmcA n=1 Tax=Cobetia TaxID=204286 RepID=UPI0015831381|nr:MULTISPECIES: GNAT family N-acetyltransferase [Cobetia]MDI4661583.1 GNAT family N-acetyltransferase [Cobetia sp. BMC6]NUJ56958.1 tRNA(Met) cytidine acetyltransferase [Cobetia marina]